MHGSQQEHQAPPGAAQQDAGSQQQGEVAEPQVVLAKSSDAGSASSGQDLGKTMTKAWTKVRDAMTIKDTKDMTSSFKKGE